jgi:hypothetical protein
MENILENRNIAFHGINYDYFKMMSILQYGILSQDAVERLGLSINRKFAGYNENDRVSLSNSPSLQDPNGFKAFDVYVKKGISFVIDTNELGCIPATNSGIEGEVFVKNIVPTKNIIGIMIPEEATQMPISELNILSSGMATGFVDDYAISFIDKVNAFFETEFSKDEIIELIEKKKGKLSDDFFEAINQKDQINLQINEVITRLFDLGFRKKYGYLESPTLVEAIEVLTGGNIPIYTTSGNLLSIEDNKTL